MSKPGDPCIKCGHTPNQSHAMSFCDYDFGKKPWEPTAKTCDCDGYEWRTVEEKVKASVTER